jgi:hypothetical protein
MIDTEIRTPTPAPLAEDLPPRLRCVNGQLVKPNGQPLRLRGVTFGSWGEDGPEDAQPVREMGGGVVRIALRFWGRHGSNPADVDSRDNDGFSFLKRANVAKWLDMISAASAAGLWVVPFIDSNCGQSGTQDAETMTYCDPYAAWGAQGRNFLSDPAMRRTFASVVWPAVAARLRPIARIAMLELQPEMMDGRGPEVAGPCRDFYREVIAGVRQVDGDTPILTGPRGGYDINYCDEAWLEERDDVVYTGNLLSGWVTNREKFDQGLAKLVRMRDERGVPIFVQQLGRKTGDDRDLNHMRYALDRMDEEGVGYAWWQWKQNTGNPEEYALNFKNGAGGWTQKTDEVALLAEHWKAAA